MVTKRISELVTQLELGPGAFVSTVQEVQSHLGFSLPKDYIDFLTKYNGAEGFVGNSYLVLWQIEEIISINKAYLVHEFAPGLLLFGSNGGGEAYAFDTRSHTLPVVNVPFVGMALEEAKVLGQTFSDFLEYLNSRR